MRRFLAGLLVLAFSVALMTAVIRADEDQQIPVEVLKQVKAATAFVKVRFEKSEGAGTAFLVATEGTTDIW